MVAAAIDPNVSPPASPGCLEGSAKPIASRFSRRRQLIIGAVGCVAQAGGSGAGAAGPAVRAILQRAGWPAAPPIRWLPDDGATRASACSRPYGREAWRPPLASDT